MNKKKKNFKNLNVSLQPGAPGLPGLPAPSEGQKPVDYGRPNPSVGYPGSPGNIKIVIKIEFFKIILLIILVKNEIISKHILQCIVKIIWIKTNTKKFYQFL